MSLNRVIHRTKPRPTAVGPITFSAGIDQARKALRQLGIAEPEGFHHPIEKILDQHVSALDQLEGDLLGALKLEIQRDRPFLRVEHQEGVARAAGRKIRSTENITGPWRLDLDHVGAEIGELHGAIWGGINLAEIDHADAIER